jgi:phosphatidylglycerol:prolipoprotein diacylglycerol transferase
MHPVLFRIPIPGWELPIVGKVDAIPIYSYGVMLGLSLVVGWYLTLGLAEKDGLPRETMANNYVVTALVAVLASRLLYVVTNLDEFRSIGEVFSFRGGGLVAYGGFLGGFVGSWAYLGYKRIRLLPWADVAVPSLASGLAITRIGCYLFGCDFGARMSDAAPAWLQKLGSFPHWAAGTVPGSDGAPAWVRHHRDLKLIGFDAPTSLPVHPTQLYESLIGVGLLALLLWARRRQRFRGQIFLLFTFAYGVCRFLIELLRDDPERGSLPPALAEHVLLPACLVLFAIGYAASFARMVENEALRRVTGILAFVPAVVAYLALRPQTFAPATPAQLSTSQFIGLATALATAVVFAIFHRAALAHPETAMALELPEAVSPARDADAAADEAPAPDKSKSKSKDADADDAG